MAMEVMLCHRDGYCLARNKLPHLRRKTKTIKQCSFLNGMDQLFGSADLPWQPHMAGLVAKAVLETPEGKRHYHDCFSVSVYQTYFRPQRSRNLVDQQLSQLRPFVPKAEFLQGSNRGRLRSKSVLIKRWQKPGAAARSARPSSRWSFMTGRALLGDWAKIDQPGSGEMEKARPVWTGKQALYIRTASEDLCILACQGVAWPWAGIDLKEEPASLASNRFPPPARTREQAFVSLGGARQSENLVGDSAWRRLEAEFEVNEAEAEVEFICELRATAGEVWF